MTAMKAHKRRWMTARWRRRMAAVAVLAVAVAAWQVSTHGANGEFGVLVIPGATAEPTGPPGPTGDPGGMNGGQFQPPGLPPQQPDYQGGINQPPLDQNNGISIYNTGAQGLPQQAGQQGAQQGNPGQQPQHGNQQPDYQTATPYTQGPGQTNPNYQAPQQGNQAQQPQQGEQQQSQAPTQTQSPQNQQDGTQQLRDMKQQCDQAAQIMDVAQPVFNMGVGAGSALAPPKDPVTGPGCSCTNPNGQRSMSNDDIKDLCFEKHFKENLGPTMVKSAFMGAFRKALTTAVAGCVITSEIGCWEGAIMGFVGGFVTSLPISVLIKAAKAAALCYFGISIPDSNLTLIKDLLWPF